MGLWVGIYLIDDEYFYKNDLELNLYCILQIYIVYYKYKYRS